MKAKDDEKAEMTESAEKIVEGVNIERIEKGRAAKAVAAIQESANNKHFTADDVAVAEVEKL
jgi:ribosomal protein L31E